MATRRLVMLLVPLALVMGLAACGSSNKNSSNGSSGGNSSATPVDLGTPLTNKGSKDLGSSMAATLELEADDNYFKPTFIKAAAGAKVTVELKNEGAAVHTFTIDGTSVDKELQPDSTASVEVTVPSNGALEFHCKFHGSLGMKGAFYTKSGESVTNASAASTGATGATTTSAGGLYGG